MTTQTIARPVMTTLAADLYATVGEALDAAMTEAEQNPGPDTQRAMEAIALAYQTLAEEFELG